MVYVNFDDIRTPGLAQKLSTGANSFQLVDERLTFLIDISPQLAQKGNFRA